MNKIATTEANPSLARVCESIKVTDYGQISNCSISEDGTTVIVARSTDSGSMNLGDGIRIPTHDLEAPSLFVYNIAVQKLICSNSTKLSDFETFATSDGGLVAKYERNRLTVINVMSGEQTHEFEAHASSRNTIAISDDGKSIGFLSGEREYTVVKISSGEKLIKVSLPSGKLAGAEFSRSGNSIILYDWDILDGNYINHLLLINLDTGQRGEFFLPADWLHCLWIDQSAWKAITLDGNGRLQTWELEPGATTEDSKKLPIEAPCSQDISTGHKGHGLAVGGGSNIAITYGYGFSGVKLWSMKAPPHCTLLRSHNRVSALSNVSSDGKFAVCTSNGFLHVFSTDASISAAPDFNA